MPAWFVLACLRSRRACLYHADMLICPMSRALWTVQVQGLRRGVAIHHGGLPKTYRQVVEILFRAGHLRVRVGSEQGAGCLPPAVLASPISIEAKRQSGRAAEWQSDAPLMCPGSTSFALP